MDNITDIILSAIALYFIGFLFIILLVAMGYQGGDMITEHYRSVLQSFIN